jgi:hypothetical protein
LQIILGIDHLPPHGGQHSRCGGERAQGLGGVVVLPSVKTGMGTPG